MVISHKNSKKQSDAGLGVAIGWFAGNGYTVCIPLTDSQEYDLVVDIGGLKKIQVKTSTFRRNGMWVVDLRTKGGNRSGLGKTKLFSKESVDYIFVVTGDDQKYLIPSCVCGVNSIGVGPKFQSYRIE